MAVAAGCVLSSLVVGIARLRIEIGHNADAERRASVFVFPPDK